MTPARVEYIASPCMRYGVTMVDECKQGTPTSNMHMNKWNEHISHI